MIIELELKRDAGRHNEREDDGVAGEDSQLCVYILYKLVVETSGSHLIAYALKPE